MTTDTVTGIRSTQGPALNGETNGHDLVQVKNLVKYFPVRGGLLQRGLFRLPRCGRSGSPPRSAAPTARP